MDKINKSYQISSKITKIAEVDKRYIELTMIVSDTNPNLNGVQIPKDVLIANADSIVQMPLVVDKVMLEGGFTNSLTHKYENGELKTDVIGVFTEAWVETSLENEDYAVMMGKAIVYKRFPATVDAIKSLYEDDDLKFSWELVASEVEEKNGISVIKNFEFEGHAIVSQPAYPIAKAKKLVASLAEAYNKDLDNINSNDVSNINEPKEQTCVSEEVVKSDGVSQTSQDKEGGRSIDMNKKLQEFLSEILKEKSIDDVRMEIAEAIKASVDVEEYGIYIYDMYISQVVYEQWDKESYQSEYFRVPYTISDNAISVNMESRSEVTKVWMDKSDLDAMENPMLSEGEDRKLSEVEVEKSELEKKISELEEQVKGLSVTNDDSNIETKNEDIKDDGNENLQSENEEKEDKDSVDLAKKVLEMSEAIEKLQEENEILKPYRDKVIAEEKKAREEAEEAEKTRLSEMVLRNIKSEEIPEEVKPFISEMDEDKVILWIARNTKSFLVSEVKEEDDNDEPVVVETAKEETLVKEQEKFKLV